MIAVDMNVLLEELTQETKNFQNIFWYICKNDQDFYSAPQLDETVKEQVRHQTGAYHTIITHGHSYLVLKGSLKSMKWDYFQLLPYDAITRSRHYVFRVYVICHCCRCYPDYFPDSSVDPQDHPSHQYPMSENGLLSWRQFSDHPDSL